MRFKVIAGTALWLFSAFAFGKLPAQPVQVQHPDMLQLFAADATLEVLAEGFSWAEGPVADPATGDILFSDVPANKVYRWSKSEGLTEYLAPSGYTGLYPDDNPQQGANGLIYNQQQQLVLAQHGDRVGLRLPLQDNTHNQLFIEQRRLLCRYEFRVVDRADAIETQHRRYFVFCIVFHTDVRWMRRDYRRLRYRGCGIFCGSNLLRHIRRRGG